VNSGANRADRADVRYPTDSYFVRLEGDSPEGHGPSGRAQVGREGLGAAGPKRRRRRRRVSGRAVFLTVVLLGLGSWTAWASQRPGGVSGTVDGWISNVRGDVAKVSADPDLARARRYYNGQYTATKTYPNLTDSELSAVGVGIGVTVDWCNPQAIVLEGASGAGTQSRLLVSGRDYGEVPGKYGCPADLTNPTPWKAR
jgi:hypothetical protein